MATLGMVGLPQLCPCEKDQSSVAMEADRPGGRARSTRAAMSSRVRLNRYLLDRHAGRTSWCVVERARAAGAVGLIATLDWSFSHGREPGGQPPPSPRRWTCGPWYGSRPEALAHPVWLSVFARSGIVPDLSMPNMVAPGQRGPTFFGAYGDWMQTPPLIWDEVAWLREQWDGAFMLKGVSGWTTRKRAVHAGMSAISVSNHGGNNLDGTPATIAPAAAKPSAMLRPMPLLYPVTRAVFPLRSKRLLIYLTSVQCN